MNLKLSLIAALALTAAGSAEAASAFVAPPTATVQQAQYYVYDNWQHSPRRFGPWYHQPPVWRYQRRFRSHDPEFHNGP
ncbi:hypothetical protein M2323_001510 [Rhodoblastus acidophilus]|uniref:hypothetical protein n=1 Tax=Rhodoblastus acidophilus TaxID=1074 RepID=UPI0022250328|nr:hypothetical protein [Rhodoblastus acidophilus]MCW2283901.1 hypothetical protein [Rhodoblastus acidophilus]MCW2332597.1 hypothetical protein [Rhodoblastus acidophilus]